jgi:hypothetical protein
MATEVVGVNAVDLAGLTCIDSSKTENNKIYEIATNHAFLPESIYSENI